MGEIVCEAYESAEEAEQCMQPIGEHDGRAQIRMLSEMELVWIDGIG